MERPPELMILGVIPDECEGLVRDLSDKTAARVKGQNLDDSSLRSGLAESDIVIHCTPIGMHPKTDATLVPKTLLRPEHVVFDIVYTPRRTRLLEEAESVGCKTIPGLEMFVNQAVVQFELWTGQRAPTSVMRTVVEQNLG
jgi:shikimate dehydrogenase